MPSGPTYVYVDTDLLVNAAIEDLRHTRGCRNALETLLYSESTVHYSIILGLEYVQAIQIATALHYEIPAFWTCDDHFQRVEELAVEIIRDPA